jgi:exodeoxyribonuclease-3
VLNSGRGLVNLPQRGEWDQLILEKLVSLDKQKPVIYVGDLNVAHEEIGILLLFQVRPCLTMVIFLI